MLAGDRAVGFRIAGKARTNSTIGEDCLKVTVEGGVGNGVTSGSAWRVGEGAEKENCRFEI